MEQDKLLEIKAVLALLKIGKTNLYKCIKTGLLPKPKKIGRRSLWLTSELNTAIRRLGNSKPKENRTSKQ